MTSQRREAWDELWSEFEQVRAAVSRSRAVHVNAAGLRTRAREFVEVYFRQVRPALVQLGIGEPELEKVDRRMQSLLALSNGRNTKTSYVRVLHAIATERTALMALRERLLGESTLRLTHVDLERGEGQILATLRAMLPNAALSYEQSIRDLQTGDRISWRGTAAEFREVVREVLDHLAPDDEVVKQSGFKLEKDRDGPTMKQKASFVLRSRGAPETARKPPQEAVSIVDELTASFVRSTYQRGSISTHGSPTMDEVERLKGFVDVALSDLLEVRGTVSGVSR